MNAKLEQVFQSLPAEEREAIISYGVALRFTSLSKRLFLAESQVRRFEDKYETTLTQWDRDGLPDDAGYEAHEDYIMWHHWASAAEKTRQEMASLQELAQEGLRPEEMLDVRD